jgi:hypothetical protein
MKRTRSILQAVGSLWLAAVLVLLVLVAMAYATVFESLHGTEQALATYYRTWWFQGLLALVALNALAALLYRWPFTKRQAGFVFTHAGLLVALLGTLVTREYGVDGQLGLGEGDSGDRFYLTGREALVVSGGRSGSPASGTLEIADLVHDRFAPADLAGSPGVSVGDLRAQVLRYLPDSDWQQQVTDDNPAPQVAVEVSLSASGRDAPVWLFPDQAAPVGTTQVTLRAVNDHDELQRLLSPEPGFAGGKGRVRVDYQGTSFEFPVEAGLKAPVPVGETGYTARVLRYLPHAIVGQNKEIVNVSDRPVNPYVEVELDGPAGKQTRRAFAKFPDFASGHAGGAEEGPKVRLLAATDAPLTPVEVLRGPAGDLHVRFADPDGTAAAGDLAPGAPVDTPWPGQRFAVLRQFDHARSQWQLAPIAPAGGERTPGILVRLSTAAQTNEVWLQKGMSRSLTVDGAPFGVAYVELAQPLGFSMKLEQFRIGRYPGSQRPRTFESHVTVTDPHGGRTQSTVISMNHPFSFGGYTFYQSSYRRAGGDGMGQSGAGKYVSFLSVAHDPGQPIVFGGYIILIVGMIWVLATRMADRTRRVGSKVNNTLLKSGGTRDSAAGKA